MNAKVDSMINQLEALVAQLDDAALKDIIAQEATLVDKGKRIEQLSPESLKGAYAELIKQLKTPNVLNSLLKGQFVNLSRKDDLDLPRTINLVVTPEGQIQIFLETKSKTAQDVGYKQGQEFKTGNPKPVGAFKHGTPCVQLWPRTPGIANKQMYNLVVPLPDLAEMVHKDLNDSQSELVSKRDKLLEELKREVSYSNQNHAFVQSQIMGGVYRHRGNDPDERVSLYGEAAVGDAKDLPKFDDPSRKDRIIYSFLLGMEHLHHNQVAHMDIKVGNILIRKDKDGKEYGKAHDFGFSRPFSAKSGLVGSPENMDPAMAAQILRASKASLDSYTQSDAFKKFISEHPELAIPDEMYTDPDSDSETWYEYAQGVLNYASDLGERSPDGLTEAEKNYPIETLLEDLEAIQRNAFQYYAFSSPNAFMLHSPEIREFINDPHEEPKPLTPSTPAQKDIWGVGCLLFDTYFNDISDNVFDLIFLLDKNMKRYQTLQGKIDAGTASDNEKMLYVMANCLQLDPNQRCNISEVLAHLPDQTLVAAFRLQAIEAKIEHAIQTMDKGEWRDLAAQAQALKGELSKQTTNQNKSEQLQQCDHVLRIADQYQNYFKICADMDSNQVDLAKVGRQLALLSGDLKTIATVNGTVQAQAALHLAEIAGKMSGHIERFLAAQKLQGVEPKQLEQKRGLLMALKNEIFIGAVNESAVPKGLEKQIDQAIRATESLLQQTDKTQVENQKPKPVLNMQQLQRQAAAQSAAPSTQPAPQEFAPGQDQKLKH